MTTNAENIITSHVMVEELLLPTGARSEGRGGGARELSNPRPLIGSAQHWQAGPLSYDEFLESHTEKVGPHEPAPTILVNQRLVTLGWCVLGSENGL